MGVWCQSCGTYDPSSDGYCTPCPNCDAIASQKVEGADNQIDSLDIPHVKPKPKKPPKPRRKKQ